MTMGNASGDVPPQISESELSATLRQAAGNLYSFGRLGRGMKISSPSGRVLLFILKVAQLYLGQVARSRTAMTTKWQ